MKKIILPGIVSGIVTLILGMGVSYFFKLCPAVAADYLNPNLIRSWQDPLMSLFFFHPFIQGIILAWAWNRSKTLFQGTWTDRGIKFGFVIWFIASVPGMFISYSSFPLSLTTIISWTVSGLINGIASGIIFAKMNT